MLRAGPLLTRLPVGILEQVAPLLPTHYSPQGNHFSDALWILSIPLGSNTKEAVLEACPDDERKYGAKSLGGGLDGVSTLLMRPLVIP